MPLNRELSLSLTLPCDLVARFLDLSFALPDGRTFVCDPQLQREAKLSSLGESLQQLKEQLPASTQGKEKLKDWWNANDNIWL